MVETNGIFVRYLPRQTRTDDIWDAFNSDQTCCVEDVLFPLDRTKSTAYVQFSGHPERLLRKHDHTVLGKGVLIEAAPWPAYSTCTAEVDPVVVASIPHIPHCIDALKEDFGVTSEYSAETGKFVIEGSFAQLSCTQTRLEEILEHQQELQKHHLMRLASREQPQRYGGRGVDESRYRSETDDRMTDGGQFQARESRHHDPVLNRGQDWSRGSDRMAYGGEDVRRQNLGLHGAVVDRADDRYEVDQHRQTVSGRFDPTHDHYHQLGMAASSRTEFHQSTGMSRAHCDAQRRDLTGHRGVGSCPHVHTAVCPSCQHSCGQHHGCDDHHHVPYEAHAGPSYGPVAIAARPPEEKPQQDFPNASSEVDLSTALTCDLDYYVVEYIMLAQRQRVTDIENEFGVTVKSADRVCDEIVTVAFQRYNPTIQTENEEKARRTFLALYEAVYRQIVQRSVQANVKPPMTAADLIRCINSSFKDRLFVSASSDDVIVVVGPFEEVTTVEAFIHRYHTRSHAYPQHGYGAFPDDEMAEAEFPAAAAENANRGFKRGSEGPMKVFQMGGEVSVKIYSSDITVLPLDVIVNAANERLQNYAGVAGAIERAGGDLLRQDCEMVVERGGPLKVTEVIHTPCRGQLRCRHIVHTVGPMWSVSADKSRCTLLLQRTFENVLHYASRVLQATSIAIPAIGTGMFGVPLDVCAHSMYAAVKEVVDKVSSLTLREVHLVNIDPATTEFIQSVFEQLSSSEGDANASLASKEPSGQHQSAGAQSLSPDSERPPHLGQEKFQTGDVSRSSDRFNTEDADFEEDDRPVDDQGPGLDHHSGTADEKVEDDEKKEEHKVQKQPQQASFDEPDKNITKEHSDDDDDDDVCRQEDNAKIAEQEIKNLTTRQVLFDQDQSNSTSDETGTKGLGCQEPGTNASHVADANITHACGHQVLEPEVSTSVVPDLEKELKDEDRDRQTVEKVPDRLDQKQGDEELGSSQRPDPHLDMCMQELSLEEFREDLPCSQSLETGPSQLSVLEEPPNNTDPQALEPAASTQDEDDLDEIDQ